MFRSTRKLNQNIYDEIKADRPYMLNVLDTPSCPTLDSKSKFFNKKSVERRTQLGLTGDARRQINVGLIK